MNIHTLDSLGAIIANKGWGGREGGFGNGHKETLKHTIIERKRKNGAEILLLGETFRSRTHVLNLEMICLGRTDITLRMHNHTCHTGSFFLTAKAYKSRQKDVPH